MRISVKCALSAAGYMALGYHEAAIAQSRAPHVHPSFADVIKFLLSESQHMKFRVSELNTGTVDLAAPNPSMITQSTPVDPLTNSGTGNNNGNGNIGNFNGNGNSGSNNGNKNIGNGLGNGS